MEDGESDRDAIKVNGNGASSSWRPHVLVIPFEEEGHFTAFLQLIYFLRSFDVVVTVCTSDRRVKQLRQLLNEGEFGSLDLRLVLLSDDRSNTADKTGATSKPWDIPAIMKIEFQTYREKLAAETDPNAKPTCLVAGIFLDWCKELADELKIPRYVVAPSAGWASYAALKWTAEGAKQSGRDKVVEFPGQFSAPGNEMPTILFPFVKFDNLAGILINTFEELEGEKFLEGFRSYLKHTTKSPESKVARCLPVGPMVNIPGYSSSLTPKDDNGQKSKALEWLDEQAASSVVYVAFGTMVNVPPPLILELARGLELSGVPFLWVLRSSNSNSDDISTLHSFLPPGFLDRVKTRGYVETAWAPQLQILQHPSTGAFLSHCGWNSSIESIASGVPVLTWHMNGDQPANARFIVDGLKVGLPLLKLGSTPGAVVKGEDVAATINLLMVDDMGKEVRKNSIRFKELGLESMRNGGSSRKNLDQFIGEVFTNQPKI